MAEPTYHYLDLAAGTGMLGIGFKLACETIGIRAVAVGGCERDACAAATLLEVVEHSQGSRIPVWDDLRTFLSGWSGGVERVDAICAGYPCQPFSSAGKRLGDRDPRHLWPEVRRLVQTVKPGIVFLENVDGHVTKGLGTVLRDLQEDGYRVACGVFSAEEVGAPHGRKRVFIVGVADTGYDGGAQPEASRERRLRNDVERASEELGNPQLPGISLPSGVSYANEGRPGTGNGHDELRSGFRQRTIFELADAQRQPGCPEQFNDARERQRSGQVDQSVHGGPGKELANHHQPRLEGGRPAGGLPSWQRGPDRSGGIFPPGRTDYRRWAELVADGLDPSLMPAIESGVSVVADGMATPADILRLGGNGVVPLQAAWAFLSLFACLMESVVGEQ